MSCGHLSAGSAGSSGSGWRWTVIRARLLVSRSGHEPRRQLASFGPRFHQSTASVQLPTLIFGRPTRQFFRPNVIEQSAKTVAIPIISSASTTPCASAVAASSERRSRFRKSWSITSARSGTLSTTITQSNAQNTASLLLHDYQALTGPG